MRHPHLPLSLALPLALLPLAVGASLPARGLDAADLVRRLSAGKVVAISDGDFEGQTYATGRLARREAGHRDLLTVLSVVEGRLVTGSLPVSNSVTAAPEILAVTRDGGFAVVAERLGERPLNGEMVRDLPPGRRLFAVNLSDPARPRLAGTVEVDSFPEALALSPDGRRVAVVSNTPEASSLTIVPFEDGRFGAPERVDLATLGITGAGAGPRGGVTATNVQWHPGGRALAVNVNTQNRIAFLQVGEAGGRTTLARWGEPVTVGADPFVGRFSPDGRYYFTSNWGRNFSAADLAGRLPERRSTLTVVRLPDIADPGDPMFRTVATVETDASAEGLAVSPDGRFVATVNMRGSAFPPESPRHDRYGSVTLLAFDPDKGAIEKVGDVPLDGVLPEGGAFDATGEHFLATVFHGHDGAGPASGPGLHVFRLEKGGRPALTPLGRIPLPHGVHYVAVAP